MAMEAGGMMDTIRKVGRPTIYPWLTMKIGDSFTYTKYDAFQRAGWASRRYKPKKFRASNKDGAMRIWRVA